MKTLPETDKSGLKRAILDIKADFIGEDAPHAINISHETVKGIEDFIHQGDFSADIFSEAQLSVVKVLFGDSWGRYANSAEFEKYLEDNLKNRSNYGTIHFESNPSSSHRD